MVCAKLECLEDFLKSGALSKMIRSFGSLAVAEKAALLNSFATFTDEIQVTEAIAMGESYPAQRVLLQS